MKQTVATVTADPEKKVNIREIRKKWLGSNAVLKTHRQKYGPDRAGSLICMFSKGRSNGLR